MPALEAVALRAVTGLETSPKPNAAPLDPAQLAVVMIVEIALSSASCGTGGSEGGTTGEGGDDATGGGGGGLADGGGLAGGGGLAVGASQPSAAIRVRSVKVRALIWPG